MQTKSTWWSTLMFLTTGRRTCTGLVEPAALVSLAGAHGEGGGASGGVVNYVIDAI